MTKNDRISTWTFGHVTESTFNMATGERSAPVSAGFRITAKEPKMFGGTRIVDKGLSETDARTLCDTFNEVLRQRDAMLAALKYLKPLVLRTGNEDDADTLQEATDAAEGR